MFQIQIPNPCNEDWDKMSPTEKGAFCKVCSKEVIDFTKSSNPEIKNSLIDKVNPCVRILKSQMDEMNFLEWFRSLMLKTKVKYVFMFSFIIAAQNINAQNYIQPQTIKMDSIDIVNIDSAAHSDIVLEEDVDDNSITCVSLENLVWDGQLVISGGMDYPVSGTVMPITYIDELTYGWPLIDWVDPKLSNEIEFQDQITLLDEIYSFKTESDSLIFHSIIPLKTTIYLSIVQDPLGKTAYPPYNEVFDSPILLEEGEHFMKFPIGDHVHGSYTIKIKSKKGEGIARITYW